MITDAVLHKAGPDSWTAFDGAYTVTRRLDGSGWVIYSVTTRQFSDRVRSANCESLAGAREAVTAWENSRGSTWHLHLLTGTAPGPR